MITNYLQRLILIFMALSTISFSIELENFSEAVNISGKQRMFIQKMLKDYAMIGMNNTFGNPKEDLMNVIKEFEDHKKLLISFMLDNNININTKKIEPLWKDIKSILISKAEKSKALLLQEKLNKLLNKADEVTKLLATKSNKSSGEIINISGRQRMLSQQMASLYMLKVWGVGDNKFTDKLYETMKAFTKSHNILKNSTLNSDKIDTLLISVDKSFMFFKMMAKSKSKFIPSLIYKKSNDILKDMNSVTELYVRENNK